MFRPFGQWGCRDLNHGLRFRRTCRIASLQRPYDASPRGAAGCRRSTSRTTDNRPVDEGSTHQTSSSPAAVTFVHQFHAADRRSGRF
jgi:hypothetical protein